MKKILLVVLSTIAISINMYAESGDLLLWAGLNYRYDPIIRVDMEKNHLFGANIIAGIHLTKDVAISLSGGIAGSSGDFMANVGGGLNYYPWENIAFCSQLSYLWSSLSGNCFSIYQAIGYDFGDVVIGLDTTIYFPYGLKTVASPGIFVDLTGKSAALLVGVTATLLGSAADGYVKAKQTSNYTVIWNTRIVGEFNGFSQYRVFTLANGYKVQQISLTSSHSYLYNTEATVIKKDGKYYLYVEDVDGLVQVNIVF